MSLSFTQHTLEKLEGILNVLGYAVRYEKGNFKTGACLLENSKLIIVNKFSNLESRINSLAELLLQLSINEQLLDEKQKQLLYTLKQTRLQL